MVPSFLACRYTRIKISLGNKNDVQSPIFLERLFDAKGHGASSWMKHSQSKATKAGQN
jgi:hypothetical protein